MKARTVTGDVPPGDLGSRISTSTSSVTSPGTSSRTPPSGPAPATVSLQTLGVLTHNPLAIPDNLFCPTSHCRGRVGRLPPCRHRHRGRSDHRGVGTQPPALRRISELPESASSPARGNTSAPSCRALRRRTLQQLEETMARESPTESGRRGAGRNHRRVGHPANRLPGGRDRAAGRGSGEPQPGCSPHGAHRPQSPPWRGSLAILESAGRTWQGLGLPSGQAPSSSRSTTRAILARAYIEFDTLRGELCLHPNYGPRTWIGSRRCAGCWSGVTWGRSCWAATAPEVPPAPYGGWATTTADERGASHARLGVGPAELDAMLQQNPGSTWPSESSELFAPPSHRAAPAPG